MDSFHLLVVLAIIVVPFVPYVLARIIRRAWNRRESMGQK